MTDYRFVVGPGNIQSDLSIQTALIDQGGTITAVTIGVYSSMTQVLSGGTNGNSVMTGLTIPILLTENTIDMGYYSPFDGAVEQADVVTNFYFSSNTVTPYVFTVLNTSDRAKSFLEFSAYQVDWGDGSPFETMVTDTLSHTYPNIISAYTITLKQTTNFGVNTVTKKIEVPYTNAVIINPKGTAYFTPLGGSWANTPVSYNYIFTGDQENTVSQQVSSDYTTVPFIVSGEGPSRITELAQYSIQEYMVGVPVFQGGELLGAITDMNPIYTAYTIQDVNYYDYVDGQTIFFQNSSGFTNSSITAVPITKDELLMKIVDQPQINTDIYVERGKNTAYEQIRRLGEVENLSDMVNYGYGYFIIEKRDKLFIKITHTQDGNWNLWNSKTCGCIP